MAPAASRHLATWTPCFPLSASPSTLHSPQPTAGLRTYIHSLPPKLTRPSFPPVPPSPSSLHLVPPSSPSQARSFKVHHVKESRDAEGNFDGYAYRACIHKIWLRSNEDK